MTDFWKNKKVAAYIALAHHTRFISPVMEKLAALGAKTEYIIGQAERSQEITATKLKLNHSHVFDFVSGKDQEEVQANYLVLRDAFTKNLKQNYFFSLSPVTVIDKTIYASAREYVGFKNFMEKEKPDICFALHELNRWGKMFSFWSKKFNIPVITLQEGLYYGLNFGYTGHAQNSTLNLVWGERIKRKLIDFDAPGDRVIPVGNTHLSTEIEYQKKNNIRKKKRNQYKCANGTAILLLFSGEIARAEDLFPLFDAVSSTQDTYLFVKFHPITSQTQIDKWISAIPDEKKHRLKFFHDDEKTYDLMSLSDVCVLVQPSTTGLEALALDKPLIHMKVNMKQDLPYSFTELKVAVEMTPSELGHAIQGNADFKNQVLQSDIDSYFKEELSQTTRVVDSVVEISRDIITSNQSLPPAPLLRAGTEDKDWSIIIALPDNPEDILEQLQAVALNSEESGTFEVILIQPRKPSKAAAKILDSLKGDVTRLNTDAPLPQMMNRAAKTATGRALIFMDAPLVPSPGWLHHLKKGINKYGKTRILGARVLDKKNSILHAGMVVDANHNPVSAYKYLAGNFPSALKERPFKMLDHFICINRKFFQDLGGFWEKAGKFFLMDLCLRAADRDKVADMNIFLPSVCLLALEEKPPDFSPEASISFFGRWHGQLWENIEDLYAEDNTTKTEIDTALLAQSMETADIMG